jgi:hypothetical protein
MPVRFTPDYRRKTIRSKIPRSQRTKKRYKGLPRSNSRGTTNHKVYRKTPRRPSTDLALAIPTPTVGDGDPLKINRTMSDQAHRMQSIQELNTATINNTSPPVVYGKIYANWCGACAALEPNWIEVQSQLKGVNEFSVEDNELDIKRGEFVEKYKTTFPPVDGYPTIYRLQNIGGTVETYNDKRNVKPMVDWILNKVEVKK